MAVMTIGAVPLPTECKVALLLPRAGTTGCCVIVGWCLSTVRMQPGSWEDDGMTLCYWGRTSHFLDYPDFLDWKASWAAQSALGTQMTLCLDRAETAMLLLSSISVWKYNVSVKSRNTSDLWPAGITYLKATNLESVCGCKLLTGLSSALHWIPGLGLTSVIPPRLDGAGVVCAEG